jgi:cation diffusion facilitator family transporter
MKTEKSEVTQIRNITLVSMFNNLCLTGLKLTVGILGSSQAVIADAIHSLSDIATDLAVIFGVRYWSAPPDSDHPYGHRRIETIISTVIGIALVSVAIGLGLNAIETLQTPSIRHTTWIAIAGPIASVILKEIMYQWTIRVGKRLKSTAVQANAWHQRSDALSSIPALLAVVVATVKPEWAFVDAIGAIIISLFILKVAWDIIWPALTELTDRGASESDLSRLKEIAETVAGVKEVHRVRTRKLGSKIMVDLHVLVDPEISVRAGHEISENVKEELINNGPDVFDVVVHLEPWDLDQRL